MSGMVEDRVDHFLVAMDDVEDAVGQARFLHQLGEADGHRRDRAREGLRMKALPQAIAMPNIHIGIIAGKLNGVMPATDAERLAHRIDVDAGAGAEGIFALQRLRDSAGIFDHFEPALNVALARRR